MFEISQLKAKKKSDINVGKSNDPIFEIKVKCPVCNKKDITSYQLKAKSQDVEFNKFLVPKYKKITMLVLNCYEVIPKIPTQYTNFKQ